jgi:hypothetical protein
VLSFASEIENYFIPGLLCLGSCLMARQIIICLKLVFTSDIYAWRNLLGAVKLRLCWRSETVMRRGEEGGNKEGGGYEIIWVLQQEF